MLEIKNQVPSEPQAPQEPAKEGQEVPASEPVSSPETPAQ